MAVSLHRSSRRASGRHRSIKPAFSDINVTPFVDVMLVLLVIFMVTAPMLTVGVPVDLPKTRAARMNTEFEPLIVSVDVTGRSYLQEMELEGQALIERLIAVSGSNPDAKIYVRGDQRINYGRVMEIMGLIATAGFTKVSLIAEMPSGKPQGKQLQVHPANPGLPIPTFPPSAPARSPALPPSSLSAPSLQQLPAHPGLTRAHPPRVRAQTGAQAAAQTALPAHQRP